MDSNRKDETREEYLMQRRDEQLEAQEQEKEPRSGEEQENLEAVFRQVETAVGSYCELKTMNNRLILLGQVESAENLAVSIVSADGTPMPPVIFNQEIRLVIRPKKAPPLVLRSHVCGSSATMWKLDRLERFHYKESRSYFRQHITAMATVHTIADPFPEEDMPPEEQPERLPACTVLDVSLEGLRFRSAEPFERGDWVCVGDLLLTPEDRFPFTLIGQICWADRISKNEFMFGCRLAPMPEVEQDALCASIFTLQRLELQASRAGKRR